LEQGADPTIQNHKGHDVAYEAELNDKTKVVEWILTEGGAGLEEGLGGGTEEEVDDKENSEISGEAKDETTGLEENIKKVALQDVKAGKLPDTPPMELSACTVASLTG
jgi:uncharacterized protein